jgi:hypothetical protein
VLSMSTRRRRTPTTSLEVMRSNTYRGDLESAGVVAVPGAPRKAAFASSLAPSRRGGHRPAVEVAGSPCRWSSSRHATPASIPTAPHHSSRPPVRGRHLHAVARRIGSLRVAARRGAVLIHDPR